MDAAFNLDDNYRANFLRVLMQSLGCTYISIWKYNPSNYFLFFLDGLYHEDSNTKLPTSSSGSLARRLFEKYSQSVILGLAENDQVPGLAFRNSTPYLELQELDLRRLASNDTQMQFYQTAVFMGCKIGEIELGLSNVPQMNMKMELRSWFPEVFPSQTQLGIDQDNIIPSQTQLAEQINPIRPPTDNQKPLAASSSSSSLRSLSMDNSPEYSSLLFNINNPTTTTTTTTPNTTSPHNIINISQAELQIDPNNIPLLMQPLLPSDEPLMILPHQQAMQAFARLRNVQFPTPETEDAAMTKAILAVLTSPLAYPASSSSSAYSADHPHHHLINPKSSAFKNYDSTSSTSTTPSASCLDRHRLSLKKSLFKRSVSFFRSLNLMRNRQRLHAAATAAAAASATTHRPTTSTQLHHMISERKRREKLNESFQSLRSLLPPGTKKDKASVLNTTTEYLNSLKAQVEELSRRNKQLEAQVLSQAPAGIRLTEANKYGHLIIDSSSTSDHQRVDVRIRHVSESTSEEAEVIDLQVILRAAIPVDDLVLRILEFLKTDENVSLMSMNANTHLTESSSTSLNRVTLRLRVEGSEWDESAFQEAVRRVVADLAQLKSNH
ncbi:Basic helix-loop-helix transcription factor [Parasponia andersonii]|uniref:Basic helix-loop-helix transcription factor n=1 Tax=Parasponia andersonii TaxID=3476 RepID=A0A2P5BDE2_PARAD|nr:Basic helix-loop-helix transcription factor [Parasponia andersonii]